MKITVSPTLIAFASMAVTLTHGSLLTQLLGNLELQLNLCPDIDIGLGGGGRQGGKPLAQTINLGCANYEAPVSMVQGSQNPPAAQSTRASTSGSGSNVSSRAPISGNGNGSGSQTAGAANARPTPSSSSASESVSKGIGALIEIPQQPSAAADASVSSQLPSDAYSMIPLGELFPTQAQEGERQLLAEKTQRKPEIPAPTPSMPMQMPIMPTAKCVWVTPAPEPPVAGMQAEMARPRPKMLLPPAMPAPMPPVIPAPMPPAMPMSMPMQMQMPAPPSWQSHVDQQAGMAAAGSSLPPGFQHVATAATRTIQLPDGGHEMVVETRNAGFFEYSF
ncbi:hypothetical protein LPJ72_002230 [Coemansia sp. Benny D160-2]|nr:hypothetical protein LPJ72_002230 [Coemansia sp. Benny D160-2]